MRDTGVQGYRGRGADVQGCRGARVCSTTLMLALSAREKSSLAMRSNDTCFAIVYGICRRGAVCKANGASSRHHPRAVTSKRGSGFRRRRGVQAGEGDLRAYLLAQHGGEGWIGA